MLTKTDAQWRRIQAIRERRISSGGFANRTDAAKRARKSTNRKGQ